MNKVNFTAGRIDDFVCEKGKQQAIYWDAKTQGLGLRATANGAKSYIFETRLHGKTLRITIGDIRTWSISSAQTEARRLKTLTDQGIDPRQQKVDQKLAIEADKVERGRQALTVGEVWLLYLESNKSSWGDRHYDDHIQLAAKGGKKKKRGRGMSVAGPLASLMPLKLIELTSETLATWLTLESKTRGTSAALSYRLLRAFIRWVNGKKLYLGLIDADAYSAQDVRKAIKKGAVKDDCLQREQLPAWFDAVIKIDNPVISAYLQSLLLTGARRNELLGLRWDDVDFNWLSLSIRDKMEGKRTIPLTPYVASLLMNLKGINETPTNIRKLSASKNKDEQWLPSPWVFSSKTSCSGKLAEPRIAHIKAVSTAGLPHLTIHGLRRSFGTLCEWVEVPVGISAQIMGHKPSAIAEKHYRRRPIDLLRSWHEKIEDWILEQADIKFTPTVRNVCVAKSI